MADATAKAPKPNVGTSIAILVSIPKASIVPVTISMMAKAWGMKRDPGGIDCPEIIRHPEVMSMAAMPHLTRRRARPFRFDFIEAVAKRGRRQFGSLLPISCQHIVICMCFDCL